MHGLTQLVVLVRLLQRSIGGSEITLKSSNLSLDILTGPRSQEAEGRQELDSASCLLYSVFLLDSGLSCFQLELTLNLLLKPQEKSSSPTTEAHGAEMIDSL